MLDDLKSDRVGIILDAVNLIDSAHAGEAETIIGEGIRRLGERTAVLHMKDFEPAPEMPRPRTLPCGKGRMDYTALLRLARERVLPMTLENTTPENAEETRIWLEEKSREAF
jgi:sugar phosphate isomerase/epimerase